MLYKRIRIGLSLILFIGALTFLWSNILVLDDFHPSHDEIVDTMQTSPDSPTPGSANPQSGSSWKGYHVHINLDELQMYVYKNNELLKTYPVSGGKPRTPSPLGTWRIISKDTWGEGFGGAWMGFNVPYGKFGIHGTIYPWFIGKSNSSKGCIRMKNSDVKELYKIVPHGTTVTIVHTNRVFRALKSGDIGSDVVDVQKALKQLGYYHGGADGKFGNMLKSSIIKFQKEYRIYGNGILTRQTYDLIMQKQKELEQQRQQELEQQQQQQIQPSPIPSLPPSTQPSIQPSQQPQ